MSTGFAFDLAKQGNPARRRFDVLWNGESLKRREERLVLRLRRAASSTEAAPGP